MRRIVLATFVIAATALAGCASAVVSPPRSEGSAEVAGAGEGESSAPFAALAAAFAPPMAPASGDAPELQAAVAAAPVAPAEKWRFSATAFMWLAGLDSSMGIKGRSAKAEISFSEIWDNLDMSLMTHVEATKGNWSIFGDGIWMSLSDDVHGPRGNLDIRFSLEQVIAIGAVAYKFVDVQVGQPSSKDAKDAMRATAEVYGGARYNHIQGEINPKRFGSARGSLDWWDPLVGLRTSVSVTPRLALTMRGDVGGFGGSDDSSWFFMSGLDWKLTPCLYLGAGYAVLTQRYRDGNDADDFSIKEKLHGPILTVTFLF